MEIIGYLASVLIGISLGLIGGGGSILTVPVLVYLFALDTVLATTYSLFVVGSTSLVGSFSYLKKGLIDLKTAIYFGLPSIATVFLTRQFLLPAIPEKVIYLDNFLLTRSILLMQTMICGICSSEAMNECLFVCSTIPLRASTNMSARLAVDAPVTMLRVYWM